SPRAVLAPGRADARAHFRVVGGSASGGLDVRGGWGRAGTAMNGGTVVDAGGDVAAGGCPFGRLAIVNRGEPAMRLINAVREWNAEHDGELRPIRTFAVTKHVDGRDT